MLHTDQWGIDSGYEDCERKWCATAPETRAAILAAMGASEDEPGPGGPPPVLVIRPGKTHEVGRGEVVFEDGGRKDISGALRADLPLGYHEFFPAAGGPATRLIVTPGKCPLDEDRRAWGWAAQLYAVRSCRSWGMGDLGDLRELARWSGSLGAGLLLTNPLFAAAPVLPQQASPYYPSTRRFRNPLYLRIEELPGGDRLQKLGERGRALNGRRLIRRDSVIELKMEALGLLWAEFAGSEDFDHYRAEQGEALRQFAIFNVLAEAHGGGWNEWPHEFRRPEMPAVARYAEENADRVRFHEWLQWLLDCQLRDCGGSVALMQDLPVGVDPAGADVWVWQDLLARGVSFGAPPDPYSAKGQDWGLPPFIPHKLRAAGYQPFIETIRAALRHAGGLRIDHVMGLFRLFWIPRGTDASGGAYVRYAADDLLGIVALESHRAGAFVVGEDLGTVEEGVRDKLREHNILSSRLLWFEEKPPAEYPRRTLAAVTTHDLPTVAGLWTGADLQAQKRIGAVVNEEGAREMRERFRAATGLPDDAPASKAVLRAHELLAEAPSLAITATLDDALGVEERPNMPGTIDQWPNWCVALPKSLEEIEGDELVNAVANRLNGISRAGRPAGE